MNNNQINDWELTVGLEVHIQLSTKTKMFCTCPASYGAEPNSLVCPICIAMPGSLPMINQKAINMAIKLGHALNFTLNKNNTFARKNYYYPDLPKGYQITQFDRPICENGCIEIENNGKNYKIGITRAHLEEDSGKLIHHSDNFSFVDLNRAGCPLIEIVSEPEMHSSQEAKLYLEKLKQIIRYIDISDCNMEKGNLRVDINVSVKKETDLNLGTRREIKNLNSFKSVKKAIDYEYKKQIKIIEQGSDIEQCTLSWDEKNNKTKVIRKKEDAHDYRYFPEPDLPDISLDAKNIEKIKNKLPELPDDKLARFLNSYKVKKEDLKTIVSDLKLADYFESIVKLTKLDQETANWILVEMLAYINQHGSTINNIPIEPERIANLIILYSNGKLSNTNTKKIFKTMLSDNRTPNQIMDEEELMIIEDSNFIEELVKNIFSKNENEFNRLKNGEMKLMGFFIGEAMKEAKGKANPKEIQKIINKQVSGN